MLNGERKNDFIVFLLFFFAIFAVFWPGLIGGKIFARIFTTTLHYPVFELLSQSFDSGRMLFWAEHLSGFPVILSPSFGLLHPFNFVFIFFDSIFSYNWLLFINFLLAGFFTYLFSKDLGISRNGSIIAGFSYIFSHIVITWGSVNVWYSFYPLFPIVFFSLLKISRGNLWYFFLGFFAFSAGWLGSYTEQIFYIAVLGFFFAILVDALNLNRPPDKKNNFFKKFKTLIFLILMFFLSVIVASPWLFPAINLTNLSLRFGGVEFEASKASHSFFRMGDIIKLFYPYLSPPDFLNRFANIFSEIPVYFGILPLFFVLISFYKIISDFRKKRAQNGVIRFFAAVGLLTFLMQIEFTRLFEIIHSFPIFNLFRGAWKWLFFTSFSFAILAGHGFDNAKNIKETPFFKIFIKILKIIIVFVLAAVFLANIVFFVFYQKIIDFSYSYFDKNIYQNTARLSLDFYHQRIKGTLDQIISTFSFADYHFIFSTIFILAGFAVFYLYARNRIKTDIFEKTALVIVMLNFVFIWQGYYKYLPSSVLKGPAGPASFLLENNIGGKERPYRIFRVFFDYYHSMPELREGKESIMFDIETMKPNINLFYNIASASGDDNLVSRRYLDFIDFLNSLDISGDITVSENSGIFTDTPDIRRRAKIYSSARARQILGMMNVKYILTPIELGSAISPENRVPWNKVFETKVTKHNIPVYIYENPEVLPRIYFAGSAKTMSDSMPEYQILEELFKIQDFKSQTLIECPENDTLCLQSAFSFQSLLSSKSDSIEIQELRPGYLKLKTISKTPRWLVYSESNLPTWEAKIKESRIWNLESGNNLNQSSKLQTPNSNFRPLKIYTANYIYQAVFIPGGENEIIFEYPGLFKQMRYAIKSLVF